jgi:hypothetical protein
VGFLDLFRPGWRHSDGWRRRRAVEKLTDQEILRRVARTDPDADVRKAAVLRLTNVALLTEIAESSSDPELREAARYRMRRITAEATSPTPVK